MYLDLLGVGGATESNNSNETGESPTSTTSTSPINSPALNCSAPTTTSSTTNNAVNKHNHSSGSTSVDYTDAKKIKVSESTTKVNVRIPSRFCFKIYKLMSIYFIARKTNRRASKSR
jgi:hypothetical protein